MAAPFAERLTVSAAEGYSARGLRGGKRLVSDCHTSENLTHPCIHSTADELRGNGTSRLRPLLDYLDVGYSTPVSVKDATKMLHMSRSNFMRLFRHDTGQSLIDYRNRLRIARAQVLLASTQEPISHVAQEVGFCSQSYFTALFRRFVTMTPLQWRRSHFSTARSEVVGRGSVGSATGFQMVAASGATRLTTPPRSQHPNRRSGPGLVNTIGNA